MIFGLSGMLVSRITASFPFPGPVVFGVMSYGFMAFAWGRGWREYRENLAPDIGRDEGSVGGSWFAY